VDSETGRILQIDTLDNVVHDTVIVRFDHRDLNRDPEFINRVTT
jgi:hypothetical protein